MELDAQERQNILYILKQLAVVSAAIESLCDDILSSESLQMGRIMNYRFLCLSLYLWRGYLDRLLKTSQKDFARQLMIEFSKNVYKDLHGIKTLRDCATHYDDTCDMDIWTAITNDGERILLSERLPPYADIKEYFCGWDYLYYPDGKEEKRGIRR